MSPFPDNYQFTGTDAVSEQHRTAPNATEQGRTGPNVWQRNLPLEQIANSEDAYLQAAETCGIRGCALAFVLRAIRCGRRDGDRRLLTVIPLRKLVIELGFRSVSTLSEALAKLTHSGLLSQADGAWRFDLAWLVELAERATAGGEPPPRPPPDEALAVFGGVRSCSAVFGRVRSAPVSVEGVNRTPESVSVSVPETDTGADWEDAKRGRGGDAEQRDALKDHPAWQRLQTSHFRSPDGRVRIDWQALRPAFYAAVEAGLIGIRPEDKTRFLATAWDLAANPTIHKPAVCLRIRVEANRCFRISDEGRRWARSVLTPSEYCREEAYLQNRG